MKRLDRERRYHAMRTIGCIPCRRRGIFGMPGDVQHPNVGDHAGQKRLGDDINYSCCPWHHRGVPIDGRDADWCTMHMGPSKALNPNGYREEFGSEADLLREQERLVIAHESRVVGRAV